MRLCGTGCEPPLIEDVVGEVDVSAVDGIEDILRPRDEEPDDGAALGGDGAEDPLGADALQEDRFAADHKGAEPVHLRAGVVQGRDAEKDIVMGLTVMFLFTDGRMLEASVRVQDGFRETRRARRIVDRGVVVDGDLDVRFFLRAEFDQFFGAVRETRAVFPDIEQVLDVRDVVDDLFDTADELRSEDQHGAVRLLEAVLDLLGVIAVVERHRDSAGLEDAEIHGQPFDGVHEEDGHLLPFPDAPGEEEVREHVGALVEGLPGHLPAELFARHGLDQRVVLPGDPALLVELRRDFDQGHFVRI